MDTISEEAVSWHCAGLLGLRDEWNATRVERNGKAGRIDIYLEYGAKSAICPTCSALLSVVGRQEERAWRHLDTMPFKTFVHTRTPRVRCPQHGVQVVELPLRKSTGISCCRSKTMPLTSTKRPKASRSPAGFCG